MRLVGIEASLRGRRASWDQGRWKAGASAASFGEVGGWSSYMGFLKWGTPKSSVVIGFSMIHHPFLGYPPHFRKPPSEQWPKPWLNKPEGGWPPWHQSSAGCWSDSCLADGQPSQDDKGRPLVSSWLDEIPCPAVANCPNCPCAFFLKTLPLPERWSFQAIRSRRENPIHGRVAWEEALVQEAGWTAQAQARGLRGSVGCAPILEDPQTWEAWPQSVSVPPAMHWNRPPRDYCCWPALK